MFFFGHRFGFLPWHNCQLEVLPMSLEDLLPMSPDHTANPNMDRILRLPVGRLSQEGSWI